MGTIASRSASAGVSPALQSIATYRWGGSNMPCHQQSVSNRRTRQGLRQQLRCATSGQS